MGSNKKRSKNIEIYLYSYTQNMREKISISFSSSPSPSLNLLQWGALSNEDSNGFSVEKQQQKGNHSCRPDPPKHTEQLMKI